MRCPECTLLLVETDYEGQRLNACSTCGGHFVTNASLKAILEAEASPRSEAERAEAFANSGSASVRPAPDAPPRECPQCGTEMRRHIHRYDSGVWVESCADHGVWLDQGELEALEALAENMRRTGAVRVSAKPVASSDRPFFNVDDDAYGVQNSASDAIGTLFDGLFR